MDLLFNSGNASINASVNFFGTSEAIAKAQVNNIQPVAPVAWNASLARSADTHNDLMISFDQQSHNLPGEPTLLARIEQAGFDFSLGGAAGENVYAFAKDILHAHAGFYIDWGNGPNGIQSPAGHRDVILSPTYTQVGIASRGVGAGKTVGPLSVTQHFADGAAEGGPFIVGVAIDDRDNDDFYDIGEGLGGVTVTATGVGGTFTTTTWASGGYSLQVAPGSDYTVTFAGQGVNQASNVSVNSSNVAVDAETGGLPPQPTSNGGNSGGSSGGAGAPTTTTPTPNSSTNTRPSGSDDVLRGTTAADNIRALGGDDLVKAGIGADTVDGGSGNDRLIGGNGNDNLVGGAGADWLGGQKGSDVLSGDGGNDTLRGADGNDTLDGGTGNDNLRGHTGRDQLFGGSGNDFLFGDVDNDLLFGDAGNDRLKGGSGNDQLVGGAGRDIFHVEHGQSKTDGDVDRIADFLFGTDVLLIEAFAGRPFERIDTREDLQQLSLPGFSAVQRGADIVLTFDEGAYSHTVILENNDLFG